jgi:hypothetical protein
MSEFIGLVTEDGAKLVLDYPKVFKAHYRQFAGHEVVVTVKKRRANRSDRQNRAFWAALTPWAHFLGYEPVELKNELLGLLWGYEERVSKLTGETQRVPLKARSSKLTTQEMSELYEFMAMKAAETGYVMELADEFNARKQAEAKRRSKAA